MSADKYPYVFSHQMAVIVYRWEEYSLCIFQPIRFVRFDNESSNRALAVLEPGRGLDSLHRPEGSRSLGTRM